jgi:hypothetical protein
MAAKGFETESPRFNLAPTFVPPPLPEPEDPVLPPAKKSKCYFKK